MLDSSVWLMWVCAYKLGRLALGSLISLAPSPGLSSSLAQKALTLFTLDLSASFSPSNWPPIRVGFARELLLVVGYAWTPSLQETVVVSWLGLLSNSLAR